jgi:SAM-dependent methyltransferase
VFPEYLLPNDGEEQERQDLNHAIYKLIFDGGLAAAPVDDAVHVLDIGTGTGIWAIEFAEAYPHSRVIGTDLSMIQPHPRTENCTFWQENSETQEWVHEHLFDYIHLRSMGPCFSDIRTVIGKSYDNLNPGGWIELVDGHWEIEDIDGTSKGTAIEKWLAHLIEGGRRAGRDMTKAKRHKQHLEEAGFVDVVEHKIPIPGAPWTKDPKMKLLGQWLGAALWAALGTYSKFLLASGLTELEIEDLTEQVRQNLQDLDIHWFLPA